MIECSVFERLKYTNGKSISNGTFSDSQISHICELLKGSCNHIELVTWNNVETGFLRDAHLYFGIRIKEDKPIPGSSSSFIYRVFIDCDSLFHRHPIKRKEARVGLALASMLADRGATLDEALADWININNQQIIPILQVVEASIAQ